MVVDWLCPGLRPSANRRPRLLHCKVILLDEHELLQDILNSTLGQELMDRVFRHLNLLETAYFGLRYLDHENQTQWLDPSKKIGKQLKAKKGDLNPDAHTLYFCVKFYAADPCKLIEEITRYQFFLQVKQDILQGRLPVSFDLAAELGAYVVQSELGDYDPRRHSYGYVSEFRFLANQTSELEARIVELHKTLVGQLPSAAELNYLDKVKWLEMYGVDLHPVLGEDCVEYFLGLTPSGIILLRNKTKVGNYYWPRINKIYHKGKYFMLRVSEKNSADRTHGFETPSRGACRHLFRCCIDHQAFFRLMATGPPPLSPYSRFRSYSPPMTSVSGLAISDKQQQMRRMAQPSFTRMPSRRAQRRVVEGQEMVGGYVEGNHQGGQMGQSQNCLAHGGGGGGGSVASRNNQNPSPRSTRSAPWTQSQPRGLYTSSSPRSVRSCGAASTLLNRLNRRSSSVESQSSVDSHSRGGGGGHGRRRSHSRGHRKHNRQSDCESQLSRGSTQKSGHRKHRRRHRSSRHSSRHEMVDSAPQWREAQRRKGEIIQRAVISTTEPRRRHRSKHRSPSSKHPLPDELRKHLEFGLVDTSGMSEQQRREIAYTVVQSQMAHHRQQQQMHHQQQHHQTPPPPAPSQQQNHHNHHNQQQQQQHNGQQPDQHNQQKQHQQMLHHQQQQHNNHHYQPMPMYHHSQQSQQQQQQQQQHNHHQHHQHQHHGLPIMHCHSMSGLAASNSRLDHDDLGPNGSPATRGVGFSVKRDRRTAYQCHAVGPGGGRSGGGGDSHSVVGVPIAVADLMMMPQQQSSIGSRRSGGGSSSRSTCGRLEHQSLYATRKMSSSSSSLRASSVAGCRRPICSPLDSGLGESTTQDFSSCCSSSADSTKQTRPTQRQLDEDGYYKVSSDTSKQDFTKGDATLDAVLQPMISTLTRKRRTKPK
ncbi:band 4.1-like protein 4 [Trichogramma pretiosum]|uniref:band 4.1-like protein 4 n=1 Tax=Trichogramma pretiosum TaxID=7493 RepID=UPI000C71A3C3|nr:band 4.1-like protein 4 [Trichogramma pretiosum]